MTIGNFVDVNLPFDTFDQLRYFDESRTTANHNPTPPLWRPEVFHVFETVYFVALNAIVTSSLLHFTFPPTFQRPARNRSARTRPKRDETIFLSLVTRFSLLHFTNVLTICFSAHKVDDEIWVWFHWISLKYYFILSWKKYCSEFSWALFRSTFEENIVSTIINDA